MLSVSLNSLVPSIQSAIRFAVYGHLAEHFQEQTENVSV